MSNSSIGNTFSKSIVFAGRLAACVIVCGVLHAQPPANYFAPDRYHAQVASFFCASASIEMMLDCPTVRNANPVVSNMLAAGDGPTYAFGYPLAGITNVNGTGVVNWGSAKRSSMGSITASIP